MKTSLLAIALVFAPVAVAQQAPPVVCLDAANTNCVPGDVVIPKPQPSDSVTFFAPFVPQLPPPPPTVDLSSILFRPANSFVLPSPFDTTPAQSKQIVVSNPASAPSFEPKQDAPVISRPARVVGQVPPGAGGAYGGFNMARQQQYLALELRQLKIETIQQQQEIEEEHLKWRQESARQELDYAKAREMIQSGPQVEQPQENLNEYPPSAYTYLHISSDIGLDGQIHDYYAPFLIHTVTINQQMVDTMSKYGMGRYNDLQVGQTLVGANAVSFDKAYAEAQSNENLQVQIEQTEAQDKILRAELDEKRAKDIFTHYQIRAGGLVLQAYANLNSAAQKGDAEAKFALPYVTKQLGGCAHIGELYSQWAKATRTKTLSSMPCKE